MDKLQQYKREADMLREIGSIKTIAVDNLFYKLLKTIEEKEEEIENLKALRVVDQAKLQDEENHSEELEREIIRLKENNIIVSNYYYEPKPKRIIEE